MLKVCVEGISSLVLFYFNWAAARIGCAAVSRLEDIFVVWLGWESATLIIVKIICNAAGVSIAIMGCIVNGPGEMADADFG